MSGKPSAAAKRGSPRGVVDVFRDRPRAGPPPFPSGGDDKRGSLESEGSASYRDVLRAEAAREAPTKEQEAESDAAADANELRRQLQREQRELLRRQEELDRRLKEEEEMQRLRRQREELQRRQEALLEEERAMERRLQEKAEALQWKKRDEAQMSFQRLPSELVAPDLTKSYSSDVSMDTTPVVQPAPSSGMRHKLQSLLQRRAPRSGASTDDSSSVDVERGDEKYSKAGKPPARNESAGSLAAVKSTGGRDAGRPFDRERRNRAMTIARKILRAILTDVDDETLMREDTDGITVAIALLKEATIGLLIALFVVSLVLFIDHRFLLGLPTARNFRRATYHLMDDKETLQTFEEAAGVKFVDEEEYASMKEEIAKAANRTQLATSILAQRSRDLWDTEREVASQVAEVSTIAKRLDLDRYCERCVWNPRRYVRLCAVQTRALEATYQSDKVGDLFASLKQRSCAKFEDKLVKTWDSKRSPFCAECEAAPGAMCSTQARALSGKHNVSPVRAMARLMIKNPRCRRASREEEEERLRHFCPDCEWDRGRTCQQRAGYLMYKDKYPARRAILAAMQREGCYRRKSGAVPAFV